MAELVDKLKHEHHIRSVGVWVTLEGYWFGIDPHSELKEKYDCRRYPTTKNYPPKMGGVNDDPQKAVEDINGEMWIPSPEKAEQFWLEWFGRMKSWGIDFVKVGKSTRITAQLNITRILKLISIGRQSSRL